MDFIDFIFSLFKWWHWGVNEEEARVRKPSFKNDLYVCNVLVGGTVKGRISWKDLQTVLTASM